MEISSLQRLRAIIVYYIVPIILAFNDHLLLPSKLALLLDSFIFNDDSEKSQATRSSGNKLSRRTRFKQTLKKTDRTCSRRTEKEREILKIPKSEYEENNKDDDEEKKEEEDVYYDSQERV